MNIKRLLAAVILGLASTQASRAAEVTLKVGDPAPKLQVGKWIQGDPVKDFEKGKAYIVEFWATWCPPCLESIPHLNQLHERFKKQGLIVIGQDVFEREEEKVPKFVKDMGDKMTYRVALDQKAEPKDKGRMAETWMMAAGLNGIPAAFVIDKQGAIAWIGHPMELQESTLESVLAGKFDVKKSAAEAAEKQAKEGQMQELGEKFQAAMGEGNGEEAEKHLKRMELLMPEVQRKQLQRIWFDVYCKKKDYDAAYKVAREVSDANESNAMIQNQFAWKILTDKNLAKRDLALAELMARRGVKASGGKDAAILDTLARALYMGDKKDEAIKTLEQAVEMAEGDAKERLKKARESYKKGELPDAE